MAVRAQHLDAEQLRELYPDVVRLAAAIVGTDAAEDVAQETFLRLLAVSKPRRPRAWLAKVARNFAIDEVRRRKRSSPVEAPPDTSVDAPDVPELLSVRRAMRDIPERYRLVLWLKHVEGRTAAEIAQMTGVTQSSVEMSLFRARRSLVDSYTKRAGLLSPIVALLGAVHRWFARGATAGKSQSPWRPPSVSWPRSACREPTRLSPCPRPTRTPGRSSHRSSSRSAA